MQKKTASLWGFRDPDITMFVFSPNKHIFPGDTSLIWSVKGLQQQNFCTV